MTKTWRELQKKHNLSRQAQCKLHKNLQTPQSEFLDSDQSFLHRVGLSFPQLQQWELTHTHPTISSEAPKPPPMSKRKTWLFSESSPKIWEFDKAVKTLPVLKLLLLKAWRPIFLIPTNCPCSHPDAIAEFWARIFCTEADTPRRGGSCCWWFCCLNWERGLENMWLADAWASHYDFEWGKCLISKNWSSHPPPKWHCQWIPCSQEWAERRSHHSACSSSS